MNAAAKPTADKPVVKRVRKPKTKTDFALADEATRALADINAKVAKTQIKLAEHTKERMKLIDSFTPAVKKLLGFETGTKAAE